MNSLPNSPTADDSQALRSAVYLALQWMSQANPHEALLIDPDEGKPARLLIDAWLDCLKASFDSLPADRVRTAGRVAAATNPGIALFNLAEQIRVLDPDYIRSADGWTNQGRVFRALNNEIQG